MTLKRSMIAITAFAILMSSSAMLNAQTPPDETPPPAESAVPRDVDDREDDFDWGWLGLLGLLGLGGLAGRREREHVVATRPRT